MSKFPISQNSCPSSLPIGYIDIRDEDVSALFAKGFLALSNARLVDGEGSKLVCSYFVMEPSIPKWFSKEEIREAFGELTRIRGITIEDQKHNAITTEKERILKKLFGDDE